jgi:glucose-6-phosphate-specific signal transduction histidine kinase
VATLVAGGAPPEEVFAAVAAEAGRLVDADMTGIGLKDRVEALGGQISLHSPPGEGTTLSVNLPLAGPHPRSQ